jgi:hypothetical protein
MTQAFPLHDHTPAGAASAVVPACIQELTSCHSAQSPDNSESYSILILLPSHLASWLFMQPEIQKIGLFSDERPPVRRKTGEERAGRQKSNGVVI